MATVKQTVTITKGRTRIKTSANATKTKSSKRGNPNRCPTCGRFR